LDRREEQDRVSGIVHLVQRGVLESVVGMRIPGGGTSEEATGDRDDCTASARALPGLDDLRHEPTTTLL